MDDLRAATFDYKGKELAFIGARVQEERLLRQKQFENEKYEVKVTEVVKGSKGDVFIDIGAYLGYFSFLASESFGRVVAIEAHPLRFGALAYNAGHFSNIRAIWGYAGKAPAPPLNPSHMCGDFFYANNPGKKIPNVEFDHEFVDIESLVREGETAMIKIDVEGGEGSVIDSCSKGFLSDPRVAWIIEIHHSVTSPSYLEEKFSGRTITPVAEGRNISKIMVT